MVQETPGPKNHSDVIRELAWEYGNSIEKIERLRGEEKSLQEAVQAVLRATDDMSARWCDACQVMRSTFRYPRGVNLMRLSEAERDMVRLVKRMKRFVAGWQKGVEQRQAALKRSVEGLETTTAPMKRALEEAASLLKLDAYFANADAKCEPSALPAYDRCSKYAFLEEVDLAPKNHDLRKHPVDPSA